MTALDDSTIARIRSQPITVQFDDRHFVVRGSRAREGLLHADLEIVDDKGEVLGFITPYGTYERGAAKAQFFGVGAPALFRSLEDALAEILR